MTTGHKHDYDEDMTCIWCGYCHKLNGAWPSGTWFQRRLAEVQIKRAQELLEVEK